MRGTKTSRSEAGAGTQARVQAISELRCLTQAGAHTQTRCLPVTILRPRRPVCSITSKQTDELALDAHPVGREDPHFVSGVGGLEGDRSAAPAEAL
jgi:hypothetical protein